MCGTWQRGNWICDGSLNSNYFSDKGRRENALQPPLLTLLDDGLPSAEQVKTDWSKLIEDCLNLDIEILSLLALHRFPFAYDFKVSF